MQAKSGCSKLSGFLKKRFMLIFNLFIGILIVLILGQALIFGRVSGTEKIYYGKKARLPLFGTYAYFERRHVNQRWYSDWDLAVNSPSPYNVHGRLKVRRHYFAREVQIGRHDESPPGEIKLSVSGLVVYFPYYDGDEKHCEPAFSTKNGEYVTTWVNGILSH